LVRLRERLSHHPLAPNQLRPTPDAALHLTLKFLGAVAPGERPAFEALVDEAVPTHPLQAAVEGWVAFPSWKSAKVIALRIAESTGALARSARLLELRTTHLGIPEERREFLPHLTLARLPNPSDVRSLLADLPHESINVDFDALVLYRSVLTPTGATYTALASRPIRHPSHGMP
jgi:2'-5' RNA ligase